jgi:2-keto-4-pentenoate hydratase/2-oxohepta-3-ene-1,7-dioic acid hydratase in catechol pathway
MGPWIVSEDEVGDPNRLNVTVRINGKIAMTANTRQHIFSPYDYIRDLSEYMLLEPGTVIAMGSFTGTTYTFIKPGDVVENEIENIGVLRNPVVAGTE